MVLKLYNTLTRTKEEFHPLDPTNVRMYVCGPTVYDFAHIGNARPAIVFDVLYRLLRHLYGAGHVTYVRNITDVDDKINARAAEEGISIRELTERTASQYYEDVAALGCLPPTHQPRATEHVPHMIAMIERLIAAGYAYPAEGHVLFDVGSKPDYGKLARRSLDEMIAGARVEVAPYKRNAMDFVLWKPSKANEPSWPSPWSNGRPGWHIECSAMSEALLGETFDIHGGGIDLVFPHHENEIAQSEGAHEGHPFARVWMHNGFLQIEGEKMSKSLGNFVTIRELLHSYAGDVLRLQMLGTHYRQPIDWGYTKATETKWELFSWAEVLSRYDTGFSSLSYESLDEPEFIEALADDLNTPLAIARLRSLFSEAKRSETAAVRFARALRFLGLKHLDKPGFYESGMVSPAANLTTEERNNRRWDATGYQMSIANNLPSDARTYLAKVEASGWRLSLENDGSIVVGQSADPRSELKAEVEAQIELRNEARKTKNFKESDRIRDELAAKGIVLKDGPSGTTWEVKR